MTCFVSTRLELPGTLVGILVSYVQLGNLSVLQYLDLDGGIDLTDHPSGV